MYLAPHFYPKCTTLVRTPDSSNRRKYIQLLQRGWIQPIIPANSLSERSKKMVRTERADSVPAINWCDIYPIDWLIELYKFGNWRKNINIKVQNIGQSDSPAPHRLFTTSADSIKIYSPTSIFGTSFKISPPFLSLLTTFFQFLNTDMLLLFKKWLFS